MLLYCSHLVPRLHRLLSYLLGNMCECIPDIHIFHTWIPRYHRRRLEKLIPGWTLAVLALTLYALCIWSYSVAVFTDPGSPIEAVLSLSARKSNETNNMPAGQWILLPPILATLLRSHPPVQPHGQK